MRDILAKCCLKDKGNSSLWRVAEIPSILVFRSREDLERAQNILGFKPKKNEMTVCYVRNMVLVFIKNARFKAITGIFGDEK